MTEEEQQELETLRREKHTREQEQRARTTLATANIPASFAALLTGEDDADTDRKTGAFCETYRTALAEDIRTRLPERAPTVTAPTPQRPQRGIQRIR